VPLSVLASRICASRPHRSRWRKAFGGDCDVAHDLAAPVPPCYSYALMSNRWDRRAFGLLMIAVVIGALWAGYNLWRFDFGRAGGDVRMLVWIVFATPFATFLGWVWARPREGWHAAFVTFVIYFFAIMVAARIERLVLGEDQAAATHHALYFQLTLALDVVACLVVALRVARSVVTIPSPDTKDVRSTSPEL
jgi:hypothetical protein